MTLNELAHPAYTLPAEFDGFHVEIDPDRERADIILDRPPLNVISMGARDQLRLVFEALDADSRVRVIVVRSVGEHFRAAVTSRGSWPQPPSM